MYILISKEFVELYSGITNIQFCHVYHKNELEIVKNLQTIFWSQVAIVRTANARIYNTLY